MPRRIQRTRVKGWRMPEGAIYVGRPTIWGNPYRVGPAPLAPPPARLHALHAPAFVATPERAIEGYRAWLFSWPRDRQSQIVNMLRGHDLVCWCQLGRPCHADVLLDLANG